MGSTRFLFGVSPAPGGAFCSIPSVTEMNGFYSGTRDAARIVTMEVGEIPQLDVLDVAFGETACQELQSVVEYHAGEYFLTSSDSLYCF